MKARATRGCSLRVEPTFTEYTGPVFEIVCQNALPSLVANTYHGIGYWWHRDHELDVVGLGCGGTFVAGECKHTSRQMTEGDLANFKRAAREVQWTPDGSGGPTLHYCCFCRSGFSDGLQSAAVERGDLSLFTSSDIVG